MTDQTPKEVGWYFAQLSKVGPYEPVEFTRGNCVLIIGSPATWDPDDFTWGPHITLPDELEGVK